MYIVTIFILCCFVSFATYLFLNKDVIDQKTARLVLINFILVYVIFVLGAYIQEAYLEAKLSSFDLDGDGFFSESEITPEQEKYMSLVVGDVGRTFAPITGLFFSFIYSIFYWAIIKLKTKREFR